MERFVVMDEWRNTMRRGASWLKSRLLRRQDEPIHAAPIAEQPNESHIRAVGAYFAEKHGVRQAVGWVRLAEGTVEFVDVPESDALAGAAVAAVPVAHGGEANRSGDERQRGFLGGEPTGEAGKDRQVGLAPDPSKPSDAELGRWFA